MRGQPDVDVRVDGISLAAVAPLGDLEIIHDRHGPYVASWGMVLGRARPAVLTGETPWVEIFSGTRLCFSGVLEEPDWNESMFTATGIGRLGEGAECLSATGAITSKLNTALDQAALRGVVPWVRGGDFGNTDLAGPEGDGDNDDPEPGKLNELLNLWGTEQKKQWRTTPEGLVVPSIEDETRADLLILPGTDPLGVSRQEVTDRVFLRYIDSTSGRGRTASYPASTPPNGVERRASITHLAPMTLARATAIAQGMYVKLQEGRTGWTNGLTLLTGQVLDHGGQLADFSKARGGLTAVQMDQPDPRGAGREVAFVVERSTWTPAAGQIELEPVGTVARTFEQIAEEANARSER